MEPFTRFGALATERDCRQFFRVSFGLVEILAQQPGIVHDHRTPAVGIHHGAGMVAAPCNLEARFSKRAQLGPIPPDHHEMRSSSLFRHPTLPGSFIFTSKTHIGERGMEAIADNAARWAAGLRLRPDARSAPAALSEGCPQRRRARREWFEAVLSTIFP